MSLSLSRSALRAKKLSGSGRTVTRRFESSTSKDAAAKAQELRSKATEGLSRVTSAAGPAISGAVKGVGNALGKVGGRTGRLIGFVERQIPLAVYYARVGLELSKLVFHAQKMAPPPVTTFQQYFQTLVKSVRDPSRLLSGASSTPSNVINQIRNVNASQLAAGGVIFAEVLGFFTVGEMIGRMKLVGYRGEPSAHH
ncbi:hypothetical protein B7463_g8911, partial [Scytalidium lignicola]